MGQTIMPPLPPESSPNYERELLAQIAYLEKELLIQIWMKAGLAIGVVLLVIAFTMNSAHAGKTSLEKLPSCAAGVMVVREEPEIHYLNPVLAIAMARQWVRDQKARRMAVPCETPRRIRSPKDERCYLKSRLP